MSEELKPCPFGTHKKQKLKMHHRKCRWYEDGLYAIQCEVCGIRGPYALGEKRAIERWNARAERTCKQEESGWSTEGDHARVWLTCGHDCMVPTVQDLPTYCPNCGAKVVGE